MAPFLSGSPFDEAAFPNLLEDGSDAGGFIAAGLDHVACGPLVVGAVWAVRVRGNGSARESELEVRPAGLGWRFLLFGV